VKARALGRLAAGFALGLAVWFGFRELYEKPVARAAEALIRAFERPAVTRLTARPGEFLLDRADFPPDSPRPGLPSDDIDFNFVLVTALFALEPRPLAGASLRRLLAALGLLFAVHVAALVCQVESVYATRLGDWSAAHYGTAARNLWAGAFHFYLVAGRFAAPFALWWLLASSALSESRGSARSRGPKASRSAPP
jgi:hypothetical protein